MDGETPRGLRARFEEQGLRPGDLQAMGGFEIVTTDSIAGMEVVGSHGLALSAHAVMMNLDVPITEFVINKLREAAEQTGANAITGLRIAVSENLVVAYGTAVTVRPAR